VPSMQAVDLVWNLERQVLYFWSRSARLMERLSELFELSFGLKLVLDSPYAAALHALEGKAMQAALQQVTLSPFQEAPRGSR
jgi:hypothetical protein